MSRDYHVYAFDGIKIDDFLTEEAREYMRNNPGTADGIATTAIDTGASTLGLRRVTNPPGATRRAFQVGGRVMAKRFLDTPTTMGLGTRARQRLVWARI